MVCLLTGSCRELKHVKKMKKVLCILLLFAGFAGHGQSINSVQAIHDYLLTEIRKLEDGESKMDVLRYETGILSLSEGFSYEYVERKLYKNTPYVIGGFVDSRVKDIVIILQSKNSKGEWETIEKVNKNTNDPNNRAIGDFEVLPFIPKQDDLYRILIRGKSENEKTARYGLMFCRVNAGSGTPATGNMNNSGTSQSTFYSIDTRRTCDWDANKKTFVNCNTQNEKSMFELNADKTIITHTTNTMKSQYYIREKSFDSKDNTTTYITRSDSGLSRTFIMDESKEYIYVLVTQNNQTYTIFFHILSTWKE